MVIDRRQIDLGGAGDHPHRSGFVTVFHEQAFGDVENAFAGIESGFLIGHEITGPRKAAAYGNRSPPRFVQTFVLMVRPEPL
jgi:hypothetical protein